MPPSSLPSPSTTASLGPEGHGPRRGRPSRRDRDPRLLLRAAARASRRRVPHVPGRDRGDAEAPGRLHADGRGRDGDQDEHDLRQGRRGPGGDARVHPREPSARLPRLRQGRRVPAAGPDLPPRAREHAHVVRQADGRQADPGLAADRARPRALHPLLPLHALLRGRRRGRPADRAEPRRAHGDRDLRGRALPLAVLGQRRRALPGRRAHLDPVPLRRAAVGHPERADRLHRLRRRLQHVGDDPRGEGQADPLAEPPGGRPRLALRQGPLLVPAPARAATGSRRRSGAAGRASRRSRGTTRSRSSRRCSASRAARSSPPSPAPRRRSSRMRSAASSASVSTRTRPCSRKRPRTRSRRSAFR